MSDYEKPCGYPVTDCALGVHVTKTLIKELFELLDRTEETDEGRVFHPNCFSSCRAADAEKMNALLIELKLMLED